MAMAINVGDISTTGGGLTQESDAENTGVAATLAIFSFMPVRASR
jgi:hypothetical protein